MNRHWGTTSVAVGVGVALAGSILVHAPAARAAEAAPPATTTSDAQLCAQPDQAGEYQHGPLVATMEVTDTSADCLRTYALDSGILDNDVDRTFVERADRPLLRTGSAMLDGLYAQAMHEEKLLSVNSVSNSDYNSGAPADCTADGEGCYITGKNWTYVWTRDLSYAADLGLAAVDPVRSRNSLEFKLSERRDATTDAGTDLQIIQDTGTGGSYPNSTDRVSWAVGASEILAWLPDGEREAFAKRAYTAIANTIEHDRHVVFDAGTGLYRGETSFLDWRQQTYPAWTASDVTQITTSESLSTNVTHWVALDAAAHLAEAAGDAEQATRYRSWADSLKSSIRDRFWLADRGQFSQVLPNALNQVPTLRYDALATALAVITGVATPEQAAQAVENYPQTPFGPSVIWPQQQEDERSYHNKGIWPFVTAYMLRAAAAVGNDQAAAAQVDSLLRSSALFAGNYENMNITTGDIDTALNSERQTWSVAGTLGMFQEVLFGIHATDQGLGVRPFLPAQVRHQYFPGSSEVSLNRIDFRGHHVDVVLALPEDTATEGALTVTGMTVDGVTHDPSTPITTDQLSDHSVVRVQLGAPAHTVQGPKVVSTYHHDGDDWLEPYAGDRAVFGPRTPAITGELTPGHDATSLTLGIDLKGEDTEGLTMDVLRDGKVLASGIPAADSWTDTDAAAQGRISYCYSVRTHYPSGNTSQEADPACYWGPAFDRVTKIEAKDFTVGGVVNPNRDGNGVITHYMDWGSGADDTITVETTPTVSGTYYFQTDYALGFDIRSGVSSGLKRVTVTDKDSGVEAGNGILVMPNTDSWTSVKGSTLVPVHLEAGHTYTVVLSNDRWTANMSYLQANASYGNSFAGDTRGGAKNLTDIFRIKTLLRHADVDSLQVSVDSSSDTEAELGQPVTLSATATGPSDLTAEDVSQGVTIDWGDGSAPVSFADARIDEGGSAYLLTGSHTYSTVGTHTVTVTGHGASGDSTSRHTVVVRAAVALTAEPGEPDGQQGWYTSTPTLTLSVPEAPEGTQLQYRLTTPGTGQGADQDGSGEWTTTPGSFTLPEGTHTVEYRSVGAAGRAGAAHSADLRVDTVAPSVTADATPGDTDVRVALTGADETSGIDRVEYRFDDDQSWTTYDKSLTAPRTSEARTLHYRAVDRAGNTSATQDLTIEALPTPETPTGTFEVEKVLVDEAHLAAADTEFTVDYFVNGSPSPSGTLEVRAGQTVQAPQRLAAGTTLTFSERTPPGVEGATWQPARIDPGKVTIAKDTTTTVTVTNELTRNMGRFQVEKLVEGADATGVEFTFSWTPEDGETQEFTVPAGGSWTSDLLPEGTRVTLTEKKAPGLPDRKFSGVALTGRDVTLDEDGSHATLVIGNATRGVVTATNTYSERSGLAVTGAQLTGLGGLALLLIAGGVALVHARRKGQTA